MEMADRAKRETENEKGGGADLTCLSTEECQMSPAGGGKKTSTSNGLKVSPKVSGGKEGQFLGQLEKVVRGVLSSLSLSPNPIIEKR